MLKYFIILLFLISTSEFVYSHASIHIEDVANNDGYIEISIYKNKDSFINNEPLYNTRKVATKGLTIFPIKDIHEGEISIFVYHDENNDNKLNTSIFWIPSEGFSYSNNYIPKGRPNFEKTITYLSHGIPMYLKMNY
jgi:uncharacterized protein (DUF2141 family)